MYFSIHTESDKTVDSMDGYSLINNVGQPWIARCLTFQNAHAN